MNRRVLLLNLALFALAGSLGWLLRLHWIEEKQHEREIFTRAAQKKAILPPPPVQAPKPMSPAEYFDVAQRTLFSRDRNPNVVLEVKPPPPKPPVPPLPLYYGQLGLSGDPTIFLAVNGSAQKTYHAGDKLDKFKLVAFNHETITLEFNDETIEKKLEDLKPKEQTPQPQAAYSPPAAAAAPAQPQSRSLASGSAAADSTPDTKNPTIGADYGTGFHACVQGDASPSGTILDGYKKVISQTMMGQSCHWEQIK
jgi:hypothetical protein